MKKLLLLSLFLILAITIIAIVVSGGTSVSAGPSHALWWPVQSVDTMKYSRDTALAEINNPAFDSVIDTQVKAIAGTGATHVSIATPYDEQFIPILTRWVMAARKYHLNVWFRGNFSGWEGWFGYAKITRDQHLQMTVAFIKNHPDLFADGDIFTPCPECENGGPGDPRQTGDVAGFRQFMITEYQAAQKAFNDQHLQVASNYASMNGDVVRLIMNRTTTIAMGGLVVVDDYVSSPDKLVTDIKQIADISGGQVVLGEFGAPIPDINGSLTDQEQAAWLDQALNLLSAAPQISGLNYWTGVGSSTAIWNDDGSPKPAVNVLTHYFKPDQFTGFIKNSLDEPLPSARIFYHQRAYSADADR